MPASLTMPYASPNFRDFRRLAGKGNVVPLYRTVVADLLSPVAAFLKLAPHGESASRMRGSKTRSRGGFQARRYGFLLESVEGGEHVGRYTFFGVDPFQVITCRGDQVRLQRGTQERAESGNIFDYLRQTGARYHPAPVPGLPPFTGGAVGYLAYEAVRQLERLPPRVAPDVDVDDAVFMYFTNLVAFDHVQHRLFLISNVLTEEGQGSLRAKYDAAVKQLDAMERRLARPLRFPRHRPPRRPLRIRSNMTRRDYEAQVRRAQEYIRAGDVFQVVLSQRFDLPARVPPFEVYRALRVVNPSPYMYFLRLGEATLLGSSPEMLVKVTGREVEYRPIAGTRARGATEEEDLRLEQELRSDEKERAEHVMLVDLGRNDIGRVCEVSTVQVKELMAVERYSHVMHLVSRLGGRLRDRAASTAGAASAANTANADSYAALAACFPAGTLSGAPKVRACEIIDELEPTRRGLYGGAVLYLDFSGNLNSCIVIRTALIKDRRAYVQAGAGIVADSVPGREYEECVNKARAMLKAFETAQRGL